MLKYENTQDLLKQLEEAQRTLLPRKTTVVNCKKEPFDVYIGRGSKWGNPYTHLPLDQTKALYQVDTPEESVACYRTYILTNPELLKTIKTELKGKRLG
jgi:hypothetical protein